MHTSLLVHIPLWSASAIALHGTLTSPAISLTRFDKIDSLEFQVASANASPDVEFQYEQSQDGVLWDAVGDQAAPILASSLTSFASTPKGFHAVAVPAILGRFGRIIVTELSGLSDVKVTVALEAREK